ncbi:MAG TPA: hypothetical protein VMH80_07595 [Bryobacteraceae bacterium]|nr:hypothetical protein [Bryobacteraceae bacterium]
MPAVLRNISSLETTIATDHQVYAPREMMWLTISIRNPTAEVIDVPDPFWAPGAGIVLLERASKLAKELGTEYAPVDQDIYYTAPSSKATRASIQPGGVLTRRIRSDDSTLQGPLAMLNRVAPSRAGYYRLVFSYDPRSHADFEVVRPVLERFERITLPEERAVGAQGQEVVVKPHYYAFVLLLGQKYVLCRTTSPWIGELEQPAIGQAWSPVASERIAELGEPVTDLSLEPHTDGTVSVRWRDSVGRWSESDRYSGRETK